MPTAADRCCRGRGDVHTDPSGCTLVRLKLLKGLDSFRLGFGTQNLNLNFNGPAEVQGL